MEGDLYMQADKISNIIDQLNSANSPYQCVMISGEWGIGKSFQVNKEIHDLKPVGYCSLFGVNSIDDIFGQILFRLTFNKKKSRINLKRIADALDLGKLEPIKKILGHVFSPQMALEYILNQYEQKGKIILLIFDDIERINDSIDFDLFLGTVESLIQSYKYVRILFVANISQFSTTQSEIWEKYSEKVVDQVFPIEDLAENIAILESPERNAAALDFMKRHGSKNLRTLQKAHRFFLDVSHKVGQLNHCLLKDSRIEQLLCMACYSVVFESIERIYKLEGQRLCEEAAKPDTKETSYQKIARQLVYGDIESIIYNKYLDDIPNSDAKKILIKELVNFYLHGNDNISAIADALFQSQNNEKPTFYCSDEEVKSFIAKQMERLKCCDYTNLYQFLQIVDSIFVWSSVFGFDTTELALIAKKEIPKLYSASSKGDGEQLWSLNLYDDYLSSDELKEILHSLETEAKKTYYQNIIKALSKWLNLGDYPKAFDLLLTIQRLVQRPAFLNIIGDEFVCSALCNDSLLPLGSCSEKQYYCAQVAYAVAMTINENQYRVYLQDVRHRFSTDKMFLERMHQIEKSYEKAARG